MLFENKLKYRTIASLLANNVLQKADLPVSSWRHDDLTFIDGPLTEDNIIQRLSLRFFQSQYSVS